MEIDKYKPIEQLNAWSSGVSYLARDEENERFVTLRIFKQNYFSQKQWQEIARRLLRCYALDTKGNIRLHEIELVEEPFFVITEHCKKDSIRKVQIDKLNIVKKMQLMLDITETVVEAHRLGIMHERLSPETIYLSNEQNIKIDFLHSLCEDIQLNSKNSFNDWCISPTGTHHTFLDLSADIFSLGMIFSWVLTGLQKNFAQEKVSKSMLEDTAICGEWHKFDFFVDIVNQCLEADASLRPTGVTLKEALLKVHGYLNYADDTYIGDAKNETDVIANLENVNTIIDDQPKSNLENDRIGRFKIIEKIGEGGMGVVYKAQDSTDKTIVALKVISSRWAANKDALKRFYKEARLLSEVNNPYVANMLEINEASDFHYLVMEYITGSNLAKILDEKEKLTEKESLVVMIDVIRALLAAHEKNIVHRDIKPANIILTEENIFEDIDKKQKEEKVFAKLSDFGLARHIVENESLELTQSGAILGTPKYMAPEQCKGEKVDVRADIYSVGATLYHLLTGKSPFDASHAVAIISKHLNERAEPIHNISPEISDNLVKIVEKCLEKLPEDRYQNVAELLKELECVLRGEPTKLVIHPQLPDYQEDKLLKFEFSWTMKSSASELWRFVTNTERVNKAMGLVAPKYFYQLNNMKERVLFARNKSKMFPLEWNEHPYEWLHEKRMSVLREYKYGLFKWMVSIVELNRLEQGTILTHRFIIEPRTFWSRILLNYQFGGPTRKSLDRIYNQIDKYCSHQHHGKSSFDAFAEEYQIPPDKKILLQRLIQKSKTKEVSANVADVFRDFLERAPDQEVARIRPLALAKRFQLDPQELIILCLNAAREGLLILLWDIICPMCRIPSELKDTLKELKTHGHCEACNINYELDFANSVELIFRISPNVRSSDLQVYCIGGPIHSPHVISQIKLKPHECMELQLKLQEGSYILRSPQLPKACKLQISSHAAINHLSMQTSSIQNEKEYELKAPFQFVNITNDFDREIVIRLEYAVSRRDALTAAYVSSLPLFRKLFPGEVLSPEQLIAISNIILLAVNINNPTKIYKTKTDNEAFQLLYMYFQKLEEHVKDYSGSLIKTIDEGMIVIFQQPENAIQFAVTMQEKLQETPEIKDLNINVALHKGAAMVATINDRLDYFGITIKTMSYLLNACQKDEIVLSQNFAMEPEVSKVLRKYKLQGKAYKVDLPDSKSRYIIKAKVGK